MTKIYSSLRAFIYLVTNVFLLCIVHAPVAAAEGSDVSLDDAITAALSHSTLVKEIESTFASKRADAFEARTLPNPALGAEVGIPASWEDSRGSNEVSVSVTQPLRLTHGKLRNRLAALIEAAGTAEKQRSLLELITRVRLTFARAWVLSERSKALKAILPRARSLNQRVAAGVLEGVYGRGDDALFRAELLKAETELTGLSAEKLMSLGELSRLCGASFNAKRLLAPPLTALPSIDELKGRLDRSETKLQSRSKILAELAGVALEVARRDAFPELRPQLFYSRTDERANLVGVGISFDLPFWDRNNAERIRTEAAYNSAQAARSLAESDSLKESVLNAAKSYVLRRDELIRYQQKILPLVAEALAAVERQVRDGTGSIFQLWQTLRSYTESQKVYLELWTAVFSAQVELSLLLEEEI